MNTFFVNFTLHNYKNDGWAFKTERKDDLDDAIKLFHKTAETYIKSDFDLVCVTITDAFGNIVDGKREVWRMENVPVEAPVAEEVEE